MTTVEMGNSLLLLTKVLHKHHDKQVWILIDEYDTPIQTAYVHGFHEQVVGVMRMMFGAALKDNNSLYKGILTGITCVAKTNMFSGLNHFRMYDIDSIDYAQYFGFTEEEVAIIWFLNI